MMRSLILAAAAVLAPVGALADADTQRHERASYQQPSFAVPYSFAPQRFSRDASPGNHAYGRDFGSAIRPVGDGYRNGRGGGRADLDSGTEFGRSFGTQFYGSGYGQPRGYVFGYGRGAASAGAVNGGVFGYGSSLGYGGGRGFAGKRPHGGAQASRGVPVRASSGFSSGPARSR
jgi:hypothetical protein